jgi:hypothetical protein
MPTPKNTSKNANPMFVVLPRTSHSESKADVVVNPSQVCTINADGDTACSLRMSNNQTYRIPAPA